MKFLKSLLVLLAIILAGSLHAFPQSNPNEEQGLKPYDSWHGGDLDSVSMTNGGLVLHIPLVSFPQRGNLDLTFSVRFSNKQWQKHVSNKNFITWNPLPLTGTQIVSSVDWWMNQSNDIGNGTWRRSVTSPDGNSHAFGVYSFPSYPLQSIDATGLLAFDTHTLILPNGTRYSYPTMADDSDTGGLEPSAPNFLGIQPSAITDANGNQVTVNSSGWTDTMGRVIPGSPFYTGQPTQPGVSTSDLSTCPSGAVAARIWVVPGLAPANSVNSSSNGTRTFKLCYSPFTIAPTFGSSTPIYGPATWNLLSAIVLPDLTMWTFDYDAYADVTRLGLPTGGSISYTYAMGPQNAGSGTDKSMWVTSRTVDANDGTGGHTWTYSYSASPNKFYSVSGKAVVTSPAPDFNDTVHTIATPVGGTWSGYDVQVQYYQGPASNNVLLKTVQTQYSGTTTSASSGSSNVVPTQSTVIFPSGLSSKIVNQYDTPFADQAGGFQLAMIGSLLQNDEYDFSNTLVRSTVNHYLWQDSSTYKNNNFLGLLVSSTIKDGAGNQVAQIIYGHDEVAVAASGIITGLVAPPAGGNVRGNSTTVSHWLNTNNSMVSSTATYFDTGMKATSTDPLGRITSYTYSPTFVDAYMTQTNMPDTGSPVVHHVISGNYDFNTGLLTSFTDENSQTYTYTYDNMLRLSEGDHPDGGKTLFSYPSPTQVERQRLISGTTYDDYKVIFDGFGRPTQTQHPTPAGTILADTTYDSLGRASTISNPYYQGSVHSSDPTYGVTTTQYDALDRTVKTIKQDGSFSTVDYTQPICPLTTDEAGKKRKACSDALGRMVSVFEDPSGLNYETDYQYDVLGNMLRVDQKGSAPADSTQWRTRTFTYDSLSHLVTANNPESGTINYAYDADGNVTAKTDARSITTSFTYDALNRVVTKNYSDGTFGAGYTYDQTGVWGTPGNNAIGRLVLAYDGHNAATLFSYDVMGRINWQWDCPPSAWVNGGCNSVKAQYNFVGDITQLTYPDGRVVINGYNSANQLNQVQFASWNGTTVGINYWSVTDTSFYPSGAPKTVTLGNGLTENATVNPRLQLQEGTILSGSLGKLADHVYNYGTQNNGNVLSVSDQISSAFTQTFTYDSLNRLATANESRWGMSYLYDAWGNYLQQNQTGGTTYQHQYTAANNNRLNGYTYDADGNMLNDGFHQYTFDGDGRISQVDNGGAKYTYDPVVGRVRKDNGSNFSEYYYFGGKVIAEQDQSGHWSDYIFAGDKRIAKADLFDTRLDVSATACSGTGCPAQYEVINFSNLGDLNGYVIQTGDTLVLRQYDPSGLLAGAGFCFTDGSCQVSYAGVNDQDGYWGIEDGVVGSWHYRRINLSPMAGKVINNAYVDVHPNTSSGNWHMYFQDMALLSANGTVHPLLTRQSSVSMSAYGAGQTNLSYTPTVSTATADITNVAQTTYYYHGDQIGSSRLMTSGGGWPVWQGTFLPYGEEYNPQITTNHYKFTGKERDSETGLDYLGARYYSNGLGRFTSADPKMLSRQRLFDPQQWNMYAYTANNPLKYVDPDGKDLTLAAGMSKADTERVTKALVEVYRKPGGAVRIEGLAKSDMKFVVETGDLAGKGYGKNKMKGESVGGKVDRSTVTDTITLDLSQRDKDAADHDMGARKDAPPTDEQVAGHEFVHADLINKDPDAQRGKSDSQKEADAAPGTADLNAEKKGDKKAAEKRVNEILHPKDKKEQQ